MSQSSQQKLLALATVAIIALLGLSAFLIYTKVNQDKLIKKQNAELIEETRIKADLEKEYYQSLSDLEEMRGNNSELNAMIETQKAELKKQKDKIDSLIKTSKDLEKAREEIAKLKSYVTEVEELRKQNVSLQETNTQLSSQRDELVLAVQQEKVTNEELMNTTNSLTTERDQLAQDKETLSKKVDIASCIKVTDIKPIGYIVKSSGKESDSKAAKKIDGVRVCFNTTSNVIVSSGQEKFYLRLINPLGEVMAIQDQGSGNMKLSGTGEAVQYTQSVELDYQPDPVNGCINWQPGIPFDPGTYTVEIYNKGFMSGKASFVLK